MMGLTRCYKTAVFFTFYCNLSERLRWWVKIRLYRFDISRSFVELKPSQNKQFIAPQFLNERTI